MKHPIIKTFLNLCRLGLVLFSTLPVLGQVIVLNPDTPARGIWAFSPVPVWNVTQAGPDILSPRGDVAIAPSGRVFYFDSRLFRVHAFSPDGSHLFSFGRKGEGPGEFKMIWGLDANAQHLVVNDAGTYHLFDFDGRFVRSIKSPGDGEGVWTDHQLLYSVEEEKNQSLFLLSMNGSAESKTLLKSFLPIPQLIAQGGGLRLRVRDQNMVSGLFVGMSADTVIFGQSSVYTLFVGDKKGRIIRQFSIKDRPRPAIPRSYKEGRYKDLELNGEHLSKAMLDQLARSIPDQGPLFNRILLHPSGWILVKLPEYDSTSSRRFDLFSPQGVYLYQGILELPGKYIFTDGSWALGEEGLVMFTEDEDGETSLAKFRLKFPPLQ